MVILLQPARDGSRLARADDPAVNLHHRNQFRARAGQETFVRVEQIVARQVRLGHLQAGFLRQLNHRLPRDAVKRARRERRREQRAVLHDEQVVAGAFGHEPFRVQHHRLLDAGVVRLDLGEDVVEIIQRLDGRVQRAVQIARRRHGHDFHAALVKFRRIKLDFVRDDDDRRTFAASRIQTERAHAARHHEPDIAVAQSIFPAGLDGRLHELGVRHREFEQNRLGGTKQPVNVFLELEHAAMISADALKNAVAVKQPVIEHGHLRVALAVIFAVNENFHQCRQGYWKKRGEANVNLRDSAPWMIILARFL